jgi:hypothetical protein
MRLVPSLWAIFVVGECKQMHNGLPYDLLLLHRFQLALVHVRFTPQDKAWGDYTELEMGETVVQQPIGALCSECLQVAFAFPMLSIEAIACCVR